MRAKKWIMVRMEVRTYTRLVAALTSMKVGQFQAAEQMQLDSRGRVSLSHAIDRLITFRARHADRVRRSKASRRGRSPATAKARL